MVKISSHKHSFLGKITGRIGPGFITGASDDDPSGIATYSQTGSAFGFTQLWTALFSFPLMATIQEVCGRISLVTGKGLAHLIKDHYSKKVLYGAVALLLIANTVNIGADLGAMAATMEMLIGIPYLLWLALITVLVALAEIIIPYKQYAKILKYLAFALFVYVIATFVIKQDWSAIVYGTLIPQIQFSKTYLLNIVAILGTTISPYLFFWQGSEEIEEIIAKNQLKSEGVGVPRLFHNDIKDMQKDTWFGMFFSNLIMFFIIATTASTLNANGITNIETAQQAAEALRPLAGDFAYILFALGIMGTGLLAVPVLAGSASYALSETLGWKTGLYRKFSDAKGFYWVIIAATLLGLLVNFLPIKPFQLLYYTAVLNSLISPPLLILIMLISNNKKIMGKHVNGRLTNILGWSVTAIITGTSLALIISMFF